MKEKFKRIIEVEWVHLDRDGNVIDSGTDVREEFIEYGNNY